MKALVKTLTILGSTGSIGKSALDIIRMHPDRFMVKALSAASNIKLLAEQIHEFRPEIVAVLDKEKAFDLSALLKSGAFKSGELKSDPFKKGHHPEILYGDEGYAAVASCPDADTALLAMVGAAGLKPALVALESKKNIALANKETLVMAGEIIMQRAKEKKISILPVDSEHSAIFQCIQGNRKKDVRKIILTASGGPFRTKPLDQFNTITSEEALNHPTWSMGNKISIDSATLMNKGLEVIEAFHLFRISQEQIEVVIHPQSIVHSMVGFKDGAIMAQMGLPDMKGAIAYALSTPERLNIQLGFPDLAQLHSLTFEKPDTRKFPSLLFAFDACKEKGTFPCVLNAANEIAVQAFLEKKIGFPDIFKLISKTLECHTKISNPDISDIIEADRWARDKTTVLIDKE
jgi:1-deoxy-D-xylulose-5-phosphate reductoisomerase